MQGNSVQIIEQAKSYFSALGEIAIRSQFGGYGVLADGTMFAVIAEGELYLRATERLGTAFRLRGMLNMIYSKRGAPITMHYYRVDQALWLVRQELFILAYKSLYEAREETETRRRSSSRLKDLPNIDAAMERLLWHVGIQNSYDLRLQGAKGTYLKLQKRQKKIGVKVLLALAGAMSGYHHAALPDSRRAELLAWFKEAKVNV